MNYVTRLINIAIYVTSFCFVILCFSCVTTSYKNHTRREIGGQFVDINNSPIKDVVLMIFDIYKNGETKHIKTIASDSNGLFHFTKHKSMANSICIAASKDGYINSKTYIDSKFDSAYLVIPLYHSREYSNYSFDGGKIFGATIDSKGGTIPGVAVRLENIPVGAASDINGNYEIHNFKSGDYRIISSVIGYDICKTERVTINSDSIYNLNFILFPQVIYEKYDIILNHEHKIQK